MKKRFIKKVFTKESIENNKEVIDNYIKEMKPLGYKVIFEKDYTNIDEEGGYLVELENKNLYALGQMDHELEEQLRQCNMDEQLESLGFKYYDSLISIEGYEAFNERFFVVYKVDEVEKMVYTAVFYDDGNSYCSLDKVNVFIPDMKNTLNE